jgi:transient receptor potential cation channel subfamily A protein 1
MAVEFGSIEVRQRETGDDILRRMQQADDMVTSLLEHGADVLAVNASDETPLHVAVRRHCKVRRLLEHGQRESQLTARDANGFTPLATAIVYIKNNSLKHLISKRYFQSCSFVVSDNRQRSLMHLAIEEHNMHAIELLLNKLDIGQLHPDWHKLTDCDGNTPLDVASVRGDESVVQLILEHSDRKDETRSQSFLSAAARGHLETCKMIVTVTNGECLRRASPDSGNSSLHLAAYDGHLEVVKFLVDKMGVSVCLTNYFRQIPLHMAARNNHLDVVQFLVSRDKQCFNFSDSAGMTSLHYAAMFDCLDVVNHLLSCGGSVSARDVIRRNALDVAIDRGHYETCCAILSCRDQWSSALDSVACFDDDVHCQNLSENVLAALNVDRLPSRDFNVMTPIRRMIEKMPQLVKIVCDKCTTKIDENTTKYFVKFFDDSLINHPVSLMIKHRREELLSQPLVIALINHKGKVALGFYLTFLTLNVCLVSLTTAFVVNSEPPQNVNWTECYLPNTELNYRDQSTTFLMACIWLLVSLGVLVEILQFRTVRHKYVREFTNYFDWFCYITTVLITLSVTPCGALTYWQWQLSAFSILASWINFITFLRRIPACGIHVAMVEQVGMTFLRFFIILFLFIIAFGFAFYILLQNQHPFASPADSLLKTAVMMTGEYDFTSIFYGHLESDEESSQIFYKASTSAVHALFLTTIFVVVDLMIGMAVGDISQLTKNAKFERLKMTFDLIFDVELKPADTALPATLFVYMESKRNCRVG